MIKINKTLIILLVALVAVLVLSAVVFFKNFKKDNSLPKKNTEELLNNVNLINKDLAISVYGNNADKTGELISKANQAWREYVNALNSGEDKPALSRDKEKKIIAVSEYLRQADEYQQEGNIQAAYEQAVLAKKNIAEIAGQKFQAEQEINAKLLDFYAAVKKMNGANNKAEAEAILPELKYKFTILKGFSPNKEYDGLIARLEQVIAAIDKSLGGSDFINARDELEPLFIKLYNKY